MTARQSRHGAATAPGLAYCYDDGGRAAARIPGRGPDHVVRAIAICAGVDYRAVRRAMAAAMRAHGYTLNGKDSAQWGDPVNGNTGRPRGKCRRRSSRDTDSGG